MCRDYLRNGVAYRFDARRIRRAVWAARLDNGRPVYLEDGRAIRAGGNCARCSHSAWRSNGPIRNLVSSGAWICGVGGFCFCFCMPIRRPTLYSGVVYGRVRYRDSCWPVNLVLAFSLVIRDILHFCDRKLLMIGSHALSSPSAATPANQVRPPVRLSRHGSVGFGPQ